MNKLVCAAFLFLSTSTAFAASCPFSREEVSGTNKHCFYQCLLTGEQVFTINSLYTCPMYKEFAFNDSQDHLSNRFAKLDSSAIHFSMPFNFKEVQSILHAEAN